jgi:ABC-type multidrug transport system ATPase subunit
MTGPSDDEGEAKHGEPTREPAGDPVTYITVSTLLDREARTAAPIPNARDREARGSLAQSFWPREARRAPTVGDGLQASRPGQYPLGYPAANATADGSANHDGMNSTPSGCTQQHIGRLVTSESASRASYRASRAGRRGLEVRYLSHQLEPRHVLVSDVCFTARPGTLTAVIGTSGAGKTTLARLVSGALAPTVGTVTLDGHDVHGEYGALRSRIAMVPQDDLVHGQLTVQQALNYAAELRLPPDTTSHERLALVARALAELELTRFADHRVATLSGGERKRVSIALELLTKPWLLVLDEPNSGLDPTLDRQVMATLRRLADLGLVVIVVTHCLTYLDVCDQVLLLTPGGKTAYCGPPAQIGRALGTTDWADIYARVAADPAGANRAFLARRSAAASPASPTHPTEPLSHPNSSLIRQIWTVARRQMRLIVADRSYFIFLAVLPCILGALALVVPGHAGLGAADPNSRAPDEAAEILILLNISAIFMGIALCVRDLVGERPIFHRDRAVGLSASAYLIAKILVGDIAVAIQTAVLTAIVIAGKRGPVHGAVLLGIAPLELYATLAVTGMVAAVLGLAISSLAKSSEQILPLLVLAIMVQLVFSGGLIPVTNRAGLAQVSWFAPSRWGFAANASTVDLRAVNPLSPPNEWLWNHSPAWWLLDMAMLTLLGSVLAMFVLWRLRLPRRRPKSRSARHRTQLDAGAPPSPTRLYRHCQSPRRHLPPGTDEPSWLRRHDRIESPPQNTPLPNPRKSSRCSTAMYASSSPHTTGQPGVPRNRRVASTAHAATDQPANGGNGFRWSIALTLTWSGGPAPRGRGRWISSGWPG